MRSSPPLNAAHHDSATPGRIEELVHEFVALWWASQSELPALGRTYASDEQEERQTQLKHFQGVVTAEARSLPRTAAERQATKERILRAFRSFGRSALDFSEDRLEALLDRGFPEVGHEFAQAARRARHRILGDRCPLVAGRDYQSHPSLWAPGCGPAGLL